MPARTLAGVDNAPSSAAQRLHAPRMPREKIERGLDRRNRNEGPLQKQRERHPAARCEEPLEPPSSVSARTHADRRHPGRRLVDGGRREGLPVGKRQCAAPPGLMKSANAYGRPSSAAQIPLCGDDPSSHGSGSGSLRAATPAAQRDAWMESSVRDNREARRAARGNRRAPLPPITLQREGRKGIAARVPGPAPDRCGGETVR